MDEDISVNAVGDSTAAWQGGKVEGQGWRAVERQHQQASNARIMEASLSVSIKAGDDSMALLFRGAIDRINEVLAPEQGANAIQNAMGQDNSPEATAGRILSLSTGFYEAYAAQHPGEDPETLARNFVDLIRGGFEKGFNEAVDILKGLQVFQGEVESGVMKTYELVQKGLDDFLAGKLKPVESKVEGN